MSQKAKMRSELDICLCNPVTNKFTTFEILIKTSNPAFTLRCSRTRRRYNDFVWLKKLLKSHHPLIAPPELPEKRSSSDRFEPQFLVQRMKELEDWLYKLVDETLYFSDSSFHLFLQTDLSPKQIQAYTSGSLSEEVVQQAYKNCDFTRDQSSFISSVCLEKPNLPGGASAAISLRDDSPALDSPRESADSGLSVRDCDSDMDSSSYESYCSTMNSDDSALTGYPALTEVKCDIGGTSPAPGHVTPTGSDVTESGKSSTSDQSNSEEDKKTGSGSHRVEMGVIFSINS